MSYVEFFALNRPRWQVEEEIANRKAALMLPNLGKAVSKAEAIRLALDGTKILMKAKAFYSK